MKRPRFTRLLRDSVAILCAALLVPAGSLPYARSAQAAPEDAATDEVAAKIPDDQLDSLVAPIALYPDALLLETLFFAGLVLVLALALYARRFWRWPFGPAWWAFTFPLDALAYAATRYAQEHPGALWRNVAALALLLATLAVATVLARTLRSAASRGA